MKLSSPRLWISICSITAVLMLAVIDVDRASPGPLASVHGGIDRLAGRGGCADCHGGWFSDMTTSCLDCHAPIALQIQGRKGLHGVLGRELAQACSACHSEHHGASFAIVNPRSFALAGVPDPKAFDHLRIGFAMEGRHLELACAECHENAEAPVLADGQARFLGLDQGCASCHEDVHEGRMQVACASCHGQTAWDQLFSLDHERWLPLTGGHADVACRTCHANDDAHSLEALGGAAREVPARECAACHSSPHEAGFLRGVAQLAKLPSGASCVTCHLPEHDNFGEGSLTVTHEQHALTGFPLEVPHEEAACESCHAPALGGFAARYPGRSLATCSACHDDPHGGQFKVGPFATQECTACHDAERFSPHAFTAEKHALASLPLTGKHLETDCNACHEVPAADAPRTFHGTPSRCEHCHADAHRGFFDAIASDLPEERRGECARCHLTSSFSEIPPPGFDHEGWTGFPVLGAHAQGECSSCHLSTRTPDDTGRTFGRVEAAFGAFQGCNTCHEDPHRGAFDADDLPIEVEGRTDCARCHAESSFRSFPHGFDHGVWTGFALVGPHGRGECSACHESPRAPAGSGKIGSIERRWGAAAGSGCADCHIDPHAGQFSVKGSTDCARCHTPALENYLDFDHDRDSQFHLGEQHRSLECAACHKPYATGQDLEVVRYRPLANECVDCHGVHEDVLMRRKRRMNG